MHPREARILRGVHSAQSEGLMEMPSGRQGLYMGDNWMIGGLDSLSKDTSSGNSLFDFGVYDGTPIDPESGSPHKGTLDDKVGLVLSLHRPFLCIANRCYFHAT